MQLETIGRYEISDVLGQGGMATVYRAHDPVVNRHVAIKVVSPMLLQQASVRERFEREVQIISRMAHSAVVPVFDFGEHEGHLYLVMAYMSGGSLAERLSRELTNDEVGKVLARIAEALDAAHQQKIIHRDVKPANILFDGYDQAYLSDFGIVKWMEATNHITGSGFLGTPAYMAPEISRPQGISPLIDVYALGATLFQMLTGVVPYPSDTPVGMLAAHVSQPIPDLHEHRPELPSAVQDVITRALAKEPAERFQSAGALAEAYQAALLPVSVSAQSAERPSAVPQPQAGPVISVPRPGQREQRVVPTAQISVENAAQLEGRGILPAPGSDAPVALPPNERPRRVATNSHPPMRIVRLGGIIAAVGLVLSVALGLAIRPILSNQQPLDEQTSIESPLTMMATMPTVMPTPIGGGGAGRIVYLMDQGKGLSKLFTLSVADTEPENIADQAAISFYYAWSPDGKVLAGYTLGSHNASDPTSITGESPVSELFIAYTDGSPMLYLPDASMGTVPAWSPDGSRFATTCNGKNICIMMRDGTAAAEIQAQVAHLTSPQRSFRWSPDGSRLLYACEGDDNNADICITEVSTFQTTTLISSPNDDTYPVWSPDGSWIAFISQWDPQRADEAAQDNGLFLMSLAGTNVRQLYQFGSQYSAAQLEWSPDGQYLSLVGGDDDLYQYDEIMIYSVEDAAVDRIPTGYLLPFHEISWNPDSSQILYSALIAEQSDVFVTSIDGVITNITNNLAADFSPLWSPDGTHILFVSDRSGNQDLYLITLSDDSVVRLTESPSNEFSPVWSP